MTEYYEYASYGPDLFGKYLKAQREGYGISLRDAADFLGISHTQLVRIEAGEAQPSEEFVLQAAELMDWDPDVLLACAGMIRAEFGQAIARCPNVFTTLFQSLIPKNTPGELLDEMDGFMAGKRKMMGLLPGRRDLREEDVIELYKALARRLRRIANDMQRMIVESDGEEDGEMGD